MNNNNFSVFDAMEIGWSKVKGVKLTFLAVLGLIISTEVVVQILNLIYVFSKNKSFIAITLYVIARIILALIFMCLSYGMIYLGVKRAEDKPIRFEMIEHTFSFRLLFRIFRLFFLALLVLLPALLLLFLPTIFKVTIETLAGTPGSQTLINVFRLFTALTYIVALCVMFYLVLRMQMARTIAIVEDVGAWTAIKRSFKMTKSRVLQLMGLQMMNFFIIILSCLPVFIGLFWSIPYYFITNGEVYKKLSEEWTE